MGGHCFARDREIDSIRAILQHAAPDTNRVIALRRLAYNYLGSAPDTSLIYADDAIWLSRRLKYSRGEARSLRIKGDALETLGNYSQSLEAYLTSLKIFETLSDQKNLGVVYTCLGILYRDQGDYKAALVNSYKALAIMVKTGIPEDITAVLTNIGYYYSKLQSPDTALLYEQEAYRMAIKYKQVEYYSNILENLGTINEQLGHKDLALKYFQESIRNALASNDLSAVTTTCLAVSRYYERLYVSDSSATYALKALESARRIEFLSSIMEAGALLANIYDTSDPATAYHYYKIADTAKTKLYSAEKLRQLHNLQYNEQVRQQEIATKIENDKHDRRENLQLICIAGFIPGLFLLLLVLTRVQIHHKVIDLMGTISALLVFEFLTLLIHPRIVNFLHHEPIFELIVLMLIAAIFAPLHHKLLHWLKLYLAKRTARHLASKPKPAILVIPEQAEKEVPNEA